jgi:IS30 family transposase
MADIWDRWQGGESLNSIDRLFDHHSSSIFGLLAPKGGIRPPPRQRPRLVLTLVEREEISRGIACGFSPCAVAAQLGRSPSTISRELRRNGGYENYRATQADQLTWDRACRPKRCKLACNRSLCRAVTTKLGQQWSPQQFAGWLKRRYPQDESHQVSHETIYKSLFIQARGVLKKELQQQLRTQRAIRRSKHASQNRAGTDRS